MIGIGRHISPLCVAAAALLLLGAAMARGEPEAERSPRADDGPFAAFGRLIDESIAGITSGFKGARDTVDDIGGKLGRGMAGDGAVVHSTDHQQSGRGLRGRDGRLE